MRVYNILDLEIGKEYLYEEVMSFMNKVQRENIYVVNETNINFNQDNTNLKVKVVDIKQLYLSKIYNGSIRNEPYKVYFVESIF